MADYNLFSLFKRKETGVLHLFHAKKIDTNCETDGPSICRKMTFNERETTIFRCKEENEARMLCAEIGREVCGTCVSNLYADNED